MNFAPFLSSVLLYVTLPLAAAAQGPWLSRAMPPPISPEQARACGPGHPWQGDLDGVNPFSRARHTDIELFEVTARGGLPFGFSLRHNSKAVFSNPSLGSKWSHSFDTHLDVWNQAGMPRAALVWGDHRVQLFERQGGTWTPLDGYRDDLVPVGTSFAVTLHDRTRLQFERAFFAGKSRHRLARIVDPSGNTISLAYTGGRLSQVLDPSGRAIALAYDGSGLLSSIRFKVAGMTDRTWTVVRDVIGGMRSVILPRVTTSGGPIDYEVSLQADSRGNIEFLVDPTGRTWQTFYDSGVDEDAVRSLLAPGSAQPIDIESLTASVVRIRDELGVEATYEYDGLSRLVSRTLGDSEVSFAYADPEYAWAPSRATTGTGKQWRLDHDARGNVVGATDPASQRWDYAYDSRNNLIEVFEPLVTDAWGVTESARHRTVYEYDGLDRLVRVLEDLDGTGSSFVTTDLERDAFGQLTRVVDPNSGSTVYSYDARGNLTRIVTPMGRTTRWLFETANATFGFSAPNAVIDGTGQRGDLVRDEWGRLVGESFPDASGAQYQYDGANRLVRMVDASGTTDWTYDPRGLVQDELRGPTLVHSDYYPNGLRAHLHESGPSGTRDIDYAYTARKELQSIVDGGLVTSFLYDLDGQLIRSMLPNGARTERIHTNGRLARVEHYGAGNVLFASYAYSYQQNGLVKSVTELGGSQVRYGYDFLDRLVREQRTGSAPYEFRWSYDAAGNLLDQLSSGVLTTYAHDADGCVVQRKVGGNAPEPYVWDGCGRLTERSVGGSQEGFAYDFHGRLTHVSRFDPAFGWRPSFDLAYDGLDRRVSRVAFDHAGQPQSWSSYTFDGSSVLREERQDWIAGPGCFQATWAHGLSSWRDTISGRGEWPATDGVGSLRKETDEWGQPLAYNGMFNAYGQPIQDAGSRPPFAFAADAGSFSDLCPGTVVTGGELYEPAILQSFSDAQWISTGAIGRGSAFGLASWSEGPIICQALFQRLAPAGPLAWLATLCFQDDDLSYRSTEDLWREIQEYWDLYDQQWWGNDFWGEKRKYYTDQIRRREAELRRRSQRP